MQDALTSLNFLDVDLLTPELWETIVLCRLPYENKEVVLFERGLCKEQNAVALQTSLRV